MRALVLDKQLVIRDVPQPKLEHGEALLKIRLAGICNTDFEVVKGYKAFTGILGHEFVAEIVDGIPEQIGRRVVGEINIACGKCDYCAIDVPSQCRSRSAIGIIGHDGAFAEYLTLPIQNLHYVPVDVRDEQAVFTEPLAAACQVLERVHIKPTDTVIVIGAGKLGLLCAQVFKLTGADLSVIARHDNQKALLNKWGIPSIQFPNKQKHADIVVDCTGSADGFADALDLVKPRGTIVLKSTYHKTPIADLTRIAVDEISVVGSRCGSFPAALRLLEQGLVDVESLIECNFDLEDAVSAMDFASQKAVLKVLLDI